MRTILIFAAVAMLASLSTQASAQTLDKNGRCRGPDGKFSTDASCKGAGPATTAAAPADPKAPYKLDAKGKCHDAKGKMAAKAKCAG